MQLQRSTTTTQPVAPPTKATTFIVHCTQPGCRFAAVARREGQAVKGIAAHLLGPAHREGN